MAEQDGHCEEVLGVLSAYIDGDLSEQKCEELASHLESCDHCREVLRSIEATRDGVGRFGEKLSLENAEVAGCIKRCMKLIRARLRSGKPDNETPSREDRNQSH